MILNGLHIIESAHVVVGPFEDWSQVRSPSRARRRRRQGHPQRIRFYYKPNPNAFHDPSNGVLYMHPATAAELRRKLSELGAAT